MVTSSPMYSSFSVPLKKQPDTDSPVDAKDTIRFNRNAGTKSKDDKKTKHKTRKSVFELFKVIYYL